MNSRETQHIDSELRFWPDGRLILGLVFMFAIIQLITFFRVVAIQAMDGSEVVLAEILPDRVVGFVIGFLFIFLIVKTTRYLLVQRWPWVRIAAIHLFFAFLVSFLWYVTFLQVASWFCTGENCVPEGQEEFWLWYLMNFDKLFLLYVLTASVTYTYYYLRRDSLNQVRQGQLETQLLQSRMKVLRSQLNPHFLFNTLNSITSLMDIDTSKAKDMVVDLSDFLRKVLDWRDTQKVSLQQELDLLKNYVDIEKIRFSDDLTVDWEIDKNSLDMEVPTMLLQPIVENVIHHAFSENHLHVNMKIAALMDDDMLKIIVTDDGQGFPETENVFEKGTGLGNIKERLSTLYGDKGGIVLTNLKPGTKSQISIPQTQ